jgi:hypothetical protein
MVLLGDGDGPTARRDDLHVIAGFGQVAVVGGAFMHVVVVDPAHQQIQRDAGPGVALGILPVLSVATLGSAGLEGGPVHLLGQGARQHQRPLLLHRLDRQLVEPFHPPVPSVTWFRSR